MALALAEQLQTKFALSAKIVNPKEKFNCYSHLISGILTLIGLIGLIFKTSDNTEAQRISWIYCVSIMFVFFASALWHSRKKNEQHHNWFTQIDEIAIFFAIAGAYTPLSYLFLNGLWYNITVGFQWLMVAVGTIVKVKFVHIKRWKITSFYLIMGWSSLLPIKQFLQNMPLVMLILLILAGISISVGSFFFISMKPTYFHEIFHILVSLGIGLHYIIIFSSIA
ncbi:hypothetical protein NEF87_003327 [Candidatus Lokiarchaeum ossiferum]|uniref:Hemolysin III family protein n=1 Tax=Candidatus Lokiarchaeum ossiferum TaxID=2951803 RepID=A0ABY6HU35_9ARCH|nr:hypothetical protein NEF87_003327 [Candidatus Lokiarchaeum sp. B-35]